MTTLQIISFDSCGKAALSAGIGKKLMNSGKKVGYIKPVHIIDEGAKDDCQDAIFIKEALELDEDVKQLCPMHLSQEELWENLTEDIDNFATAVKTSCNQVAAGKDLLIVESPGNIKSDQVSALACYTIAEKTDAAVIMVLCPSDYKDAGALQAAEKLEKRLLGVIINQVPESGVSFIRSESSEYFKARNITVLAVLPESRALLGVSVAELAAALNGEIISSKDKVNDLIENVMLGAMTPDSGRDYFNRKKNKAVITRAERADMLLAALETSTKCLIVTKQKPTTSVMVKAEDKHVPVMVVDKDINDIVAGVELALAKARFQNLQKLQAMVSLLDAGLDIKALSAALGLK
jgi:BioD-like phosphotransacetylase family protein